MSERASASDHTDQAAPDASRAAFLRLGILKKRADFLRTARGKRVVTDGFILQARRRSEPDDERMRVGFTCSKKVGNAVARNRAKRRLREIARLELPDYGRPGVDYVLIGRAGKTAARPFETLRLDLRNALLRLDGKPTGPAT